MSIFEKLGKVQTALKAPKDQRNDFAKFNYRSCEGILEAVKPLLAEQGLTLTLTDSIELIGDRFYIKATASVFHHSESFSVDGYARECLSKKGMDDAQLTGSCSSYARKYALNGLFLIDDTKDADSMDNSNSGEIEQATQEQDLPWYNDFDSHQQMMIDKIKLGESTVEQIIEKLSKQFKINVKTKEAIKALGDK